MDKRWWASGPGASEIEICRSQTTQHRDVLTSVLMMVRGRGRGVAERLNESCW